jgi:DNA invertase Pin-like site-specific DNA recombinase
MPRIYGYVRVSDEKQLGNKSLVNGELVDNTSLANQKLAISRWWEANRHRYPQYEFAGIFEDPAQSASKIPLAKRPQGSLMLTYVSRGDIIVAADPRRVFRTELDYHQTKAVLAPRGIQFLFVSHPDIDYSTPEGELMANFFSALGQYESRLFGRRQSLAHHARESTGRVTCSFCPLGWMKKVKLIAGETKVTRYFAPCKPERWMLRIFRWMRKHDPAVWTRDEFRFYVRRNNMRRGVRGEKRYWLWEDLTLADFIVSHDYPKRQLARRRQGYDRTLISAEVVRVRPRRAPASPPKPRAAFRAELLWQSPAGTSVAALQRRLNLELEQQVPAEASPPPCVSPDPCS